MNKNIESFIDYVKTECKKHKVKIKQYKRKHINLSNSIKCGGYFSDGSDGLDGGKPVLAYAQGHKDYLELLVHEYCHMTQWLDGIDLWKKANDSLELIDKWLAGEEVEDIEKHIANSRDLELDNEKRSVEMIKKWNLPIDVSVYTKKSNAYILFYNYMLHSRKWSSPENSPYTNKNIIEALSDKFDMVYDHLTEDIKELYMKENI
jgi:hypothetical protein